MPAMMAAAPVDTGAAPAPAAAGAAPERASIHIATYNTQSNHAGRLEMALRALNQMNVDFGILMETKLTDSIHTRWLPSVRYLGQVPFTRRSGVVLLRIDAMACGINQLVTGLRRIPVVGAYIPPADKTTIEFIMQNMHSLPHRCKPLLLSDLNVN